MAETKPPRESRHPGGGTSKHTCTEPDLTSCEWGQGVDMGRITAIKSGFVCERKRVCVL